jgi:hypothetical protein
MRGFHDLLRQNPTSPLMLLGWNSISMASLRIDLPKNAIHVWGFSGRDIVTVKLNMLSRADAVFGYC